MDRLLSAPERETVVAGQNHLHPNLFTAAGKGDRGGAGGTVVLDIRTLRHNNIRTTGILNLNRSVSNLLNLHVLFCFLISGCKGTAKC